MGPYNRAIQRVPLLVEPTGWSVTPPQQHHTVHLQPAGLIMVGRSEQQVLALQLLDFRVLPSLHGTQGMSINSQ